MCAQKLLCNMKTVLCHFIFQQVSPSLVYSPAHTNHGLAVGGQAGKLLMFDTAAFRSDEYLIRQVWTVGEVEAALDPG